VLKSRAHAVVLCLVIREEEEFVMNDRSANAGTVLLEVKRRCRLSRRGEEVEGVPTAVLAIGITGPMKGVAAGLEAHVDDCAGLPAKFGAGILLRVEFIDRGSDQISSCGLALHPHQLRGDLRPVGAVAPQHGFETRFTALRHRRPFNQMNSQQ
jgi:hypothetical protein